MLGITPAGAAAVSFSAPANFGVGTNPSAVAVGEFNADSDPDLAVANYGSGNVSILNGSGPTTGMFTGPTNLAAGTYPTDVAVGDFEGNSFPDLAVTNYGGANLSMFLGSNLGTFSGPTNATVGTNPSSVAVGDFNNDNDPDLAVANYAGGVGDAGNVSILLGAAGASFAAPATILAGGAPIAVEVGEFNGDSDPDLAVANYAGNASILLGTGPAAGTFTAPTTVSAGSGPRSIAVGEFNGDTDPDLAIANATSGNVSILLGTGPAAGTFASPTTLTAGLQESAVAVGEFNGDTDPDLAVANYGGGVSILLGSGPAAGTFTGSVDFAAGTNPNSVAVGEFNGDSHPDLVVGNYNGGNVSILLGQPDADDDTVGDASDNCAAMANTSQANNDGDPLGDVCDPDDDNDGVLDVADGCPTVAASTANGCTASATGQRAAALKKCKKKRKAAARKKCKKRALKLPV